MDIKTLVAQIQEGVADPEEVAKNFDELPPEVREHLDLSPDRLRGGEVTSTSGLILPDHCRSEIAILAYNPNGLRRLSKNTDIERPTSSDESV